MKTLQPVVTIVGVLNTNTVQSKAFAPDHLRIGAYIDLCSGSGLFELIT
ncbi:MAG: hypothetical protein L0229_07335 [Blastocatellia bacterium]|nr:hypothetical protein [Blastocatellia bacterium]